MVAIGGCDGWLLWVVADWCLRSDAMPDSHRQASIMGVFGGSVLVPMKMSFHPVPLTRARLLSISRAFLGVVSARCCPPHDAHSLVLSVHMCRKF